MSGLGAPPNLKKTLQLFSEAIATPYKTEKPSKELLSLVKPTQDRSSERSVEIYHCQYWWRLLNALQHDYPILANAMGRKKFNAQIGIPYLTRFPPDTWSLYPLGGYLPAWIDEARLENACFIKEAILIDFGYNEAFKAKLLPPLNPTEIDEETPITLQPHLSIHHCHTHLLNYRKELLSESLEYWEKHPLPKKEEGDFYFLIFRDPNNTILWENVQKEEYLLLKAFKSGTTLEEACSLFENDAELLEDVIFNLFQTWVSRGWLT